MNEIVAKLREYNRWRRGDEEIAQPDPGEVGRLLDAVCEMVGQLERERDIAEDERIDLAKQLRSEQERHAVCQNERDEARAVAHDLASAASHCLGWHDCRLNIGEKITATLQHWRRMEAAK